MSKLQMKEEIMAMAALLALGMLAVLASGLSKTMNIAMANMPAQSKVSWAACMAVSHFLFGVPINWQTSAACLGLGMGGTGLLINRAQAWWGIDLDETIGGAVLSALGLADYAGAAAGPIGLFVMIG
ncbi:MAG: hypothetical protein RXR06_10070 [Thermoproteus sp.]